MIELARLRPDPDQPRRDLNSKAQQELVESIRQLGQLQPITVRYIAADAMYQVIAGERRLQAARSLAWTEMACWVKAPDADRVLVQQVAENWIRSDLQPWEIADALGRLRDTYGYTQQKLAQLTGKPQSEIARLLAILTIEPETQKLARADETGSLSKRHLYAASQLEKPEQQRQLVQAIQAQKLTAAETEKLVRATKPDKTTGSAKEGAPTTRKRYVTSKATVLLTFRKRHVTPNDEVTALQEAIREVRHLD